MTAMHKSKTWRTLCWLLSLALVGMIMPAGLAPVVAQDQEAVRTFLVLPAQDNSGAGLSYLSRLLSDEVVLGVTGSPGLGAWEFNANAPQVRRAVAEGRLLPVEAESGTQSPAAALRVGNALGVDAVMLLQITQLSSRQGPSQASVVVKGQIYSVASNFSGEIREPVASPQAERSFQVTGVSREVAGYTGSTRALISEAVKDAAAQITAEAGGPAPAPTEPARNQRELSWIAYALGVGLLALLVANSSTSRAPTNALAPVPVAVHVESGGIRLLWSAPSPSDLTLLKYQVQRSYNEGPWVFIDQGLAGAGVTQWFDDTLPPGAYRYRIGAVYTDQTVSPWANFSQVIFQP